MSNCNTHKGKTSWFEIEHGRIVGLFYLCHDFHTCFSFYTLPLISALRLFYNLSNQSLEIKASD